MILDGGPGPQRNWWRKQLDTFVRDCKAVARFVKAVVLWIVDKLDIRKRDWWLAAFMFYGMTAMAVMVTYAGLILERRLEIAELQVKAIRRADNELTAATTAMSVAYGLSEQSSEFYARVYKQLARKYVIPWEAFAATTYIESHFDAMAKSPAGACGLMQLLEPTAEGECRRLKIPYRKNSTVWNAVLNIHIGCSYFNECYDNGISDPRGRLMEAFKRYLGGSKYRNYPNQEMICKYCEDVLREYDKLTYIYQGALIAYK